MQLRHKEASDYSLYTKDEGKHTHVHAAIPFAEGFVVGDATSLLFSSQAQLNDFLKSEARPNHRRFADRLFQLTKHPARRRVQDDFRYSHGGRGRDHGAWTRPTR